MNQKNAKRLRKIALGMVVAAEQKNPENKIARVEYTRTETIRVQPNTWKGVYKQLKRAFTENRSILR